MSSLSPAAARLHFWQSAGNVLTRLRGRYGWTHRELAERAGLDPELVAAYEQARVREPGLEDCWRPATALGVGLETFLQLVEREAGLRLLHNVRLPAQPGQTGSLGARIHGRQTGGLAPREEVSREGDTGQLSAFIDRLRTKRDEQEG